MSNASLIDQLEAHGTFPDEAVVRANFDLLFQLARDGQAPVADLVGGFDVALDQWSHVDALGDPAIEARLREWVLASWTTAPLDLLQALCRLLANVRSPEAAAFVQAQADAATDPDVVAVLQRYLPALRRPAAGAAG